MTTEYNNKFIPFFLRITGTKQVNEKTEGRREEEWGNIKHRPDETFHLQTEEERKRDRDE